MKRRIKPIQLLRAIIQLIAFLTVPALFVTLFSAISSIITALIGGSFTFSTYLGSIMFVLGFFLVTLIWGRFFCGFICSFGAMQDLLHAVGSLLPFRIRVSETADKWLKKLKYAVLAFVAVGVWGFSVPGDTLWSPWAVFGMYSSLSAWSSLQYFATLGGVLLILIMLGSLFAERFFCKYLCPLGAFYALFQRVSLVRLRVDAAACTGCGACVKACPMQVDPAKTLNSAECIRCGECVRACPAHALTFRKPGTKGENP